MKAGLPLLFFFQRTWQTTVFWILLSRWVAGWLRRFPQTASIKKFKETTKKSFKKQSVAG